MSRGLPSELSPRWLTVGTELTAVQVLSRWHHWPAHFDWKQQRKVRCAGVACAYCDAGMVPDVLFVLGVAHSKLGRCLLELRQRHRDLIAILDEHELEGVGCWLHLWRNSTAKNASLEAAFKKWEPADEWEIGRLVDSLGLSFIKEKVRSSVEDARSL